MERLPEAREENMGYILNNVKSWDSETTQTIVESLTFLVKELKEELKEYDTIISDDVSARLPTLFFRDIVNKKKKQEDLEPVNTYFLTPKRGRSKKVNEGIYNFISGKKIKKALVVTEHIDSGLSLKPIVKALKENHVVFDIASISKTGFFVLNVLDPNIRAISENLTFYLKGNDGLLFHKIRFSGVQKDIEENDSIHPTKSIQSPEHRKEMIQARKDIALIAEYVEKRVG